MRLHYVLPLACLVACDDKPDPLPCDFTEAADATNNAMSEDSALMIGAGTKQLCGNVDVGHFDAAAKSVDNDTFRVTAPADGAYIIQLLGDADLATLLDLSVVIRDTAAQPTIVSQGTFDGTQADHLAFLAELPAGTYDVTIAASATADLPAKLAYKLRFVEDKPDRCASITTAANYTEAGDGAANTGNDVLGADFTKDPQFSMMAGTAEPTGLTVDASSKQHISGNSAMVTGPDQYQDRDTYLISTGSSDELTIRLDWAGASDLDFAVFQQGTMIPAGLGNIGDAGAGEFQTFAVKPNTTYLVWVGNFKGGLSPMAYDVSICGGQLAP